MVDGITKYTIPDIAVSSAQFGIKVWLVSVSKPVF